ncbi:hypothetical protein KJF94_08670 [Pseudomonas hormoni]|uniref:Uncharacterized protein n=1 Tax=Pseudomonas hormoni TaxID=3093767 RepID=A0ABX8F2C7_9PSED|nr:hypothetical protein [Pseudomonas hormoni]QVW25611.1 hypothetical protein KJF94_08670 [Pseudomonas hormoni]
MEITIRRKSGFFDNSYGRCVPLLVLFDGAVVGRLATGEIMALTLPDVCGTLQVGLLDSRKSPYIGNMADDIVSTSRGLGISPNQAVQAFSVRTRRWVFFDVADLVYFGPLSRWVFAVEKEPT